VLLSGAWGIDFETSTNTVAVLVYAWRRKLATCGLPGAIETVRGIGYRLAPDLT
jgi:DNA-binding response OmpR family regulator